MCSDVGAPHWLVEFCAMAGWLATRRLRRPCAGFGHWSREIEPHVNLPRNAQLKEGRRGRSVIIGQANTFVGESIPDNLNCRQSSTLPRSFCAIFAQTTTVHQLATSFQRGFVKPHRQSRCLRSAMVRHWNGRLLRCRCNRIALDATFLEPLLFAPQPVRWRCDAKSEPHLCA